MKKRAVLTLVAFVLSCPIASADPPASVHSKSPAMSVAIASGAWLIPTGAGLLLMASESAVLPGIVLGGAGAVFGPSCGRFYAHDRSPFSLVPLRIVGLAVGLLGVGAALVIAFDEDSGNDNLMPVAGIGLVAGGATYLTCTVIDIVRAPKAVDKYNQHTIGARWQLRPAYYSASHAVGADLTIRF